MAAVMNVNEILSQVKQLDKEDQLSLLQRITSLLKRTEGEQSVSLTLTSLSGLGSEIWRSSIDIDNYIEEERQW